MNRQVEYSASNIRKILQQLFPERRLVLSQFTFFNQIGVAKPTGETSRRGRQCYRFEDMLSIATVLALKEEGIPLKNIGNAPQLIQENVEKIFNTGAGCRLSGAAEHISLNFPGEEQENIALEKVLSGEVDGKLFWSFDVGLLSMQLRAVVDGEAEQSELILRAA